MSEGGGRLGVDCDVTKGNHTPRHPPDGCWPPWKSLVKCVFLIGAEWSHQRAEMKGLNEVMSRSERRRSERRDSFSHRC